LGDPRKQRKTYETPRHPWRKQQLEEELRLLGDYGLRNKRELRHHETKLSSIRGIARSLLGATAEEREQLERQYLKRLTRLGILPETANIDNILDLTVKDLMERRLQTLVFRQGHARTIHQARQFVTHGHVRVADNVVSVPGYIVTREDESRIAIDPRSTLSNPQHPVRVMPGTKRAVRIPEEVAAPVVPSLPEVPPEIKAIAETEQPLEIAEPEEELAAEPEAEDKPSQPT